MTEAASVTTAPTPPPAKSGVTRNTGIVAAGTLISRVLGVVRDQVFAAYFSRGMTDLFFDAFTIPNALRGLLAEGAVANALVPVYTELRTKEGAEPARRFYASFRGTMLIVLFLVSLVGVLFARPIAHAYGGGFAEDPERFETFVTLTRLLFPYIFLMGLAALGAGALNAHDKFAVPAAAPALLNIALALAPLVFVPIAVALNQPPILALGIAALVGGVLQVVAQWPSLRRIGMPSWPRFDVRNPDVQRALRLLIPLTLGLGVYQLNVMMARLFGSYLEEGAISFLYYAQRLVEIPQGMFAMAVASAALPKLTRLRAEGDAAGLRATFQEALSLGLFLAIPLSAALVCLAHPTVVVLFARGQFDATSAIETARSLSYQALGVSAVVGVRVTVPMFQAHQDTRTPLLGSATNLVVFVSSAWLLGRSMGHSGIATAISLAGIAQCVVLMLLLRRKLGALGLGAVVAGALRTLGASLLAALAAVGVCLFGHWERGGNDLLNIGVFATAGVTFGLVFVVLATLLRVPELERAKAALLRRFGRTRKA